MTDLFDPLTLGATAVTLAAVVWIGHRADVARRAQRQAPVVQATAGPIAAKAAAPTPCEGIGGRLSPAVLATATHRPWLIVPEGIGGPAVLAEAEAPEHPTQATFSELVLPCDGCGAEAQVSSGETPQ